MCILNILSFYSVQSKVIIKVGFSGGWSIKYLNIIKYSQKGKSKFPGKPRKGDQREGSQGGLAAIMQDQLEGD